MNLSIGLSLTGVRHQESTGASEQLDVTRPTAPTDFAATDVTHNSVTLGWTASTDNVGVDHYELSRDGVVIADDIADDAVSYEDTGLDPETAYDSSLVAKD